MRAATGTAPWQVTAEQARSYVARGWWLNRTLTELLRGWAEAEPERVAVVDGERSVSYGELDQLSDSLAAGLSRLGIGRGDVLSLQLPNTLEFLLLHHAAAKLRAVLNPIHLPYREAELTTILGFAGSKAIVVPPEYRGFGYREMVRRLRPALPALRHLIVTGPEAPPGTVSLAELLATPPGAPRQGQDPDDPFLLLFTSGTTASPKAVLQTHNIRLANSRFAADALGLTGEDGYLSIARFSHMYGLLACYMAWTTGARHVLLEAWSPEAFLATAARHRATVAFGAPPHVVDLLGSPTLPPGGLDPLRLFVLSGSVCPPAVADKMFARLRVTPVMLWGMTEICACLYTRPRDPRPVICQTIGRPGEGSEFAILDEAGEPLPDGQPGELAFRGASLMLEGYYRNPAASAEAFTPGGWFRTGDLALRDQDGCFRILGRCSELINRGGLKFNPVDVEELLYRHPKIRMATLVGMPDERLGERNCLFVVPRPGATLTLEEVRRYLEQLGVAKVKWPEWIEVVEALPMTPTQKVQRGVLRERIARRLAEGRARPGRAEGGSHHEQH